MKKTRWFTSRKAITVVGIAIATVAMWNGKMNGGDWDIALAICIAGHHAGDLIKAWKGTGG